MSGLYILLALLVLATVVGCKPATFAETMKNMPSSQNNDDTAWSDNFNLQVKRVDEDLAAREKRDISNSNETPEILVNETSSNETSFESYEKEYLINLTMNLLKEFLHYEHFMKNHADDNNSIKKVSTVGPGATKKPGMPTALPHSGDASTPSKEDRIDTRILEQKLLELNQMDVNQLTRMFNSLHRAAEKGVEDPGITSLCCNLG